MKYSKNFIRDYKWYLSVRHLFSFDGRNEWYNNHGKNIVGHDKDGIDGIEAFYRYDSGGLIDRTKHTNLLSCLLRTKGSVNLHIKAFAEDLASGSYPKIELRAFCIHIKAPQWFRTAIERQVQVIRGKVSDKQQSNFLPLIRVQMVCGLKYAKGWEEKVSVVGNTLTYKLTKNGETQTHIIENPTYVWSEIPAFSGLGEKYWWSKEQSEIFDKLK